ncbi:uncharacterized protein LTR77_006809 [Saxophila tyrrhenica]|uniref:Uncharacterized protein n=1 Tax=Saxophila tyrrhenica TaxID=1690608 RepID=A0AAV9P991_9PEZI|nr:hypothetical protein LTR77_006809 [Saxophila tyrrhenica]
MFSSFPAQAPFSPNAAPPVQQNQVTDALPLRSPSAAANTSSAATNPSSAGTNTPSAAQADATTEETKTKTKVIEVIMFDMGRDMARLEKTILRNADVIMRNLNPTSYKNNQQPCYELVSMLVEGASGKHEMMRFAVVKDGTIVAEGPSRKDSTDALEAMHLATMELMATKVAKAWDGSGGGDESDTTGRWSSGRVETA